MFYGVQSQLRYGVRKTLDCFCGAQNYQVYDIHLNISLGTQTFAHNK